MTPQIKHETDGSLTLSVNVRLTGSLLEMEEEIARVVNALGRAATGEALESFDSDGTAVVVNNKRYTSKGKEKKSTRRRME
jgi:hypothetical protein